jgi:hypothetical protein
VQVTTANLPAAQCKMCGCKPCTTNVPDCAGCAAQVPQHAASFECQLGWQSDYRAYIHCAQGYHGENCEGMYALLKRVPCAPLL